MAHLTGAFHSLPINIAREQVWLLGLTKNCAVRWCKIMFELLAPIFDAWWRLDAHHKEMAITVLARDSRLSPKLERILEPLRDEPVGADLAKALDLAARCARKTKD